MFVNVLVSGRYYERQSFVCLLHLRNSEVTVFRGYTYYIIMLQSTFYFTNFTQLSFYKNTLDYFYK